LTIAGWIVALLLSFVLGFLMESLIGLIGFWFLEVSSLVFIYMMITFFLSGQMLPLDWLPAVVTRPLEFLPFKYLAYFPAAIMLHRYSHAQLAFELCILVGWVVALFAACRIAFALGLRRYGAYGG
jgi:ABC-2 type transport system permease protein